MSASAFAEARAAAAEGRHRAARLLLDGAVPAGAADVVFAADVYAACGAFRRGQALLRWGHKRFPDDEALRVALVRAELARGLLPERRLRNLLEKLPGGAAAVLRARLEGKPAPVVDVADRDVDVDVDLALAAFAADPKGAVERAKAAIVATPLAGRARVIVAGLLRAAGQIDEGRALLKEGSRAAEDARVEVAHAFALVVDGKVEEAGLATARLRARFPDLATHRALRLLLTTLAWAADRRDDAATFVSGATDLSPAERAAAVFLAGGPPAATTSTTAATSTAATAATTQAATTAATAATAATTTSAGGKGADAGATKAVKPVVAKTPLVDVPNFDADYQPPAAWRRPLAAVLLVCCGLYGVVRVVEQVRPELLAPFGYVKPVPDAGVVEAADVDAGPAAPPFVPRVDGRTFRANAYACGFDVPGIVDVGLPIAALATMNGRSAGEGKVVSVGGAALPLDRALAGRDDLSSRSLGFGGRAAAAVVVDDEAVVGWALLAVVAEARPPLSQILEIGKVPFTTPTRADCPAGHTGECFTAAATCPNLVVRARALCAEGAKVKAAADLAPCLLDGVLLIDATPTASPTNAAPTDAGTTTPPAPADAGTAATTTTDAGTPPVGDAGAP